MPYDVLAPMIIGNLMHVVAFVGLGGMFLFMCTRKMGAISSWLPPFLFLFGCITATLAVDYALNITAIWYPVQKIQGWWGVWSGAIALVTLGVAANRRTFILSALGVGRSQLFPSASFAPPPVEPDCSKCEKLLKSFDDKATPE